MLIRFIAVLNSFHSFFFFSFFKCFSFADMTTKFNQEMYVKMRVKKNEHISNLRKRVMRVVEKRDSHHLSHLRLGSDEGCFLDHLSGGDHPPNEEAALG